MAAKRPGVRLLRVDGVAHSHQPIQLFSESALHVPSQPGPLPEAIRHIEEHTICHIIICHVLIINTFTFHTHRFTHGVGIHIECINH
jgi:hypothetical protein